MERTRNNGPEGTGLKGAEGKGIGLPVNRQRGKSEETPLSGSNGTRFPFIIHNVHFENMVRLCKEDFDNVAQCVERLRKFPSWLLHVLDALFAETIRSVVDRCVPKGVLLSLNSACKIYVAAYDKCKLRELWERDYGRKEAGDETDI